MTGFLSKLIRFIGIMRKETFLDADQKSFIRFAKIHWPRKKREGNGEILIEMFPISSSLISFAYLGNYLADKYHARPVGYNLREKNWKGWLLTRATRLIASSFGVGKFLFVEPPEHAEEEKLYLELKKTIKTKRDVEELEIDGVWLGDLIYDSHLMNFKVPTIDLSSINFEVSLKKLVRYYLFWRDYFNNHDLKGVIVSHCVYMQYATLLRMAVARGIPAYQINWSGADYLTSDYLFAYNKTQFYREDFKKLSSDIQKQGKLLAKEKIEMRFSGKVGVDMYYSTKSAFEKTPESAPRVLSSSSKLKILVATHCFFDSPHSFGMNLFPDFYEWIDFLGKVSEKTDYEWYLKTHRDFLPGVVPILKSFVQQYPKLQVIPPETSHHQLIREGIDVTLTVYGTVGFEYAALGRYVVNASVVNPHHAYDFNAHPKTVEEYERILLNLESLSLDISRDEVCEYYFMHHLYSPQHWLYLKTRDLLDEGNHESMIQSQFYRCFVEETDEQRHRDICQTIQSFVDSKENYLTMDHLERV